MFTAYTNKTTGEMLCVIDKPSSTLRARSRLECSNLCSMPLTCVAFNFWLNKQSCDLYNYLPCNYAARTDCTAWIKSGVNLSAPGCNVANCAICACDNCTNCTAGYWLNAAKTPKTCDPCGNHCSSCNKNPGKCDPGSCKAGTWFEAETNTCSYGCGFVCSFCDKNGYNKCDPGFCQDKSIFDVYTNTCVLY